MVSEGDAISMELRQMRSFLALVEERHFGRAARRENVRQPTLSLQIARMESELGVRLFDRTSRRVRLTEAGRAIVQDAQLAVSHAEAVARISRQAVEGHHGRLRVSYAHSADCTEAAEMVSSFRACLPDVEVESRVVYEAAVVEHLRSGAVDAGFLWLPARPPADLVIEVLLSDRLVAALSDSHPLASQPSVSLDRLLEEPLALLPRSLAPAAWEALGDRLETALVVREEPSHAAIVQAVRRCGVAGLLPASATPYLAVAGVVHRPFRQPEPCLELGLARHCDHPPCPVLDAFVEHCGPGPRVARERSA
jgi:DNA-binding transcriptional LysR family regulator